MNSDNTINSSPTAFRASDSGSYQPVSNSTHEKVLEILMVEDDVGDTRLTVEALKRGKLHMHLTAVTDGIDALSFLRHEGKYRTATRPDIILLDLTLPRMDGRELLTLIRQDPDLRPIPVVVMTASAVEEDLARRDCSQESCFITKPVDVKQFMKVVQSIDHLWFTIVALPQTKNPSQNNDWL